VSDKDELITRLNKVIAAKPDSAESLVVSEAIEWIGTQARTIAFHAADLKSRDERIETLLILKDGYYSAMAAWRSSKQTGISITEALACANRGVPASSVQA